MRRSLKFVCFVAGLVMSCALSESSAHAKQVQIVALGDSLVLGSGTSFAGGSGGVPVSEAWPAVLERMLRSRGWDATITNQGVNGDTTSATLARVDSAVPIGTDLTLVIVGGKDLLNGASSAVLAGKLAAIANAVRARGSAVLTNWSSWTAGLRDPSTHYAIAKYDSGDHEHFNAAGNALIASRVLPEAERELRKRGLKPGK